jgi:hypothetical protein
VLTSPSERQVSSSGSFLDGFVPLTAEATFVDYYRCPTSLARIGTHPDRSTAPGFFSFGGARGFGRAAGAAASNGNVRDVTCQTRVTPDELLLPFDLGEVTTNLREERYAVGVETWTSRLTSGAHAENLYYLFRPLLPIGVRKHLQQLRLRGWEDIAFPHWPVDTSVEQLLRHAMASVLKSTGARQMPFVWFWPNGAPSCTMLTHDVEGKAGLDFCRELINLDASFELRSAFQLIPEGPDNAWKYAESIRARGCEVNLHDLNHDGRLYRTKAQFLERAQRINRYARQYGSRGFRSGAMYREQRWYDAFQLQYDMSVPNVAHLEPQRGGCCTVMPYFVGDVLELPLTTAQDYSLFFILNDYSIELWRQQIASILDQHGLISVITHPDYLVGERERAVYVELLRYLGQLRDEGRTWVALPGEINDWWRDRRRMTLTRRGSEWRIDGQGSERARVAYAELDGDRVVYSVESAA